MQFLGYIHVAAGCVILTGCHSVTMQGLARRASAEMKTVGYSAVEHVQTQWKSHRHKLKGLAVNPTTKYELTYSDNWSWAVPVEFDPEAGVRRLGDVVSKLYLPEMKVSSSLDTFTLMDTKAISVKKQSQLGVPYTARVSMTVRHVCRKAEVVVPVPSGIPQGYRLLTSEEKKMIGEDKMMPFPQTSYTSLANHYPDEIIVDEFHGLLPESYLPHEWEGISDDKVLAASITDAFMQANNACRKVKSVSSVETWVSELEYSVENSSWVIKRTWEKRKKMPSPKHEVW